MLFANYACGCTHLSLFNISLSICQPCPSCLHTLISSSSSSFSVKPFSQNPFGLCTTSDKLPTSASPGLISTVPIGGGSGNGNGMTTTTVATVASSSTPSWQGRAIATHKLRLLEFSAFVEQKREAESYKHHFVHIGGPVSYADPVLEVSWAKFGFGLAKYANAIMFPQFCEYILFKIMSAVLLRLFQIASLLVGPIIWHRFRHILRLQRNLHKYGQSSRAPTLN
jgi:hypothetical protein